MKYLCLSALIFSSMAFAEPCFGPGGCAPEPVVTEPCFGPACGVYVGPGVPEPTGPAELCLPDGCNQVSYIEQVVRFNDRAFVFTNAYSFLPNGWPVKGWSGPCDQDTVCSDIRNQAFSDLELNAKRANRAQRYGE